MPQHGIFTQWRALGTLLALIALRGLRRAGLERGDMGWQSAQSRAMATQVTLRGIVVRARMARMSGATW